MLTKIKIDGLFNKFNYEIELKKGITIFTGPNGYGKTTILNIIHAFSIGNLAFFLKLPFTKISLTLKDKEITVSKKDDTIKIQSGDDESITHKINDMMELISSLAKNLSYIPIDESRWCDNRTGARYTTESLIKRLIETDPDFITQYYKKFMPEFINVYLIREQRLIRKSFTKKRRSALGALYYSEEELGENFSITIEEYANELSQNLKTILTIASKVGQGLDSSFPERLFGQSIQIGEEEFNTGYDRIKEKRKLLSKYGLSAIQEAPKTSFKQENAKALLVYLNDTEKKLAVFDDILQKLEIFSGVLNERQFVSKQLEISPDFGFRFKTEDAKELSLTDLSSGEQQEVVLLYELLFKVTPDTLVLIDEPEISLHVAWQKEVINDLLKICELQKITVITATHSPQIIGEHWDLEVDLWDLHNSSDSSDSSDSSNLFGKSSR